MGSPSNEIEIVNTDTMPDDREVDEVLGIARGNTVEAKDAATDFIQGLRNTFGGELKGYSDLLTKSREKAIDEMRTNADEMGADAVINVRIDTSSIAEGGSEVLAYGTAVKLTR